MNKLESSYEAEVLKQRLFKGEALEYKFEFLKLKLAEKTFYTPDFFVVTPECVEIHEIKGHMEDDAAVKIKVASEIYWWLKFFLVTKQKGKWVIKGVPHAS